MTKDISASPARHTFQQEAHLKRCEELGVEPSDGYAELFESIRNQHRDRFNDPADREDNLEYDLLTTDWILEKVRSSESYAQNLYAALCNTSSMKLVLVPILKDQRWRCSWRSAGGIIADMRGEGDYIDWYCSGIGSHESGYGLAGKQGNGYVPESTVTDEIRADLEKLGWVVKSDEDDESV